jgi:RND family efflux transporter MFP subunit
MNSSDKKYLIKQGKRSSPPWKRRTIFFGICSACALILLGCGSDTEMNEIKSLPATIQNPVSENRLTSISLTEEAIERLGIELLEVQLREIENRMSYPGEVVIPEGSLFTVVSPFAGQVAQTGDDLKIGGDVASGTWLFRILPYDKELRGRDLIADTQREIETADARIASARQKVERAQRLLADRAGSERVLQEAETELKIAEVDRRSAAAQMEFLKSNRMENPEGLLVRAPTSGTIFRQFAGTGQNVAASNPLAEIVKLDPMWVRVPVYAGETDSIDPQSPAKVTGLGRNQTWSLKATPIIAPPSANANAATVDLYYQAANAKRFLKPGMKVSVNLILRGTGEKMIVIPRSAIAQDAYGGSWVYVAKEPGVFTRQRIDIQSADAEFAVLSRGLEPGSRIVTVGVMELYGEEFGGKK